MAVKDTGMSKSRRREGEVIVVLREHDPLGDESPLQLRWIWQARPSHVAECDYVNSSTLKGLNHGFWNVLISNDAKHATYHSRDGETRPGTAPRPWPHLQSLRRAIRGCRSKN